MTFRLTNLFYLFALVAASLTACGAGGVWVAGGVLVFWAGVFYLPRPGCLSLFLMGTMFLLLHLLLSPVIDMRLYSTPRAQCAHNLRLLMKGIIDSHDVRGRFPPAAGPKGESLDQTSWRILVAPFIDNTILPIKYNYNEPWDSPGNWKLVGTTPYTMHECPTHGVPTMTNYFAIIGPQTAWGEDGVLVLENVSDDNANTLVLIEAAGRGIHWAEPKDLTFDEAVELLTTPLPPNDSDGHRVYTGYFYQPNYVRNVAMCDGSVRSIPAPISRAAAVALLTANGEEELDPAWLKRRPAQLDYGRVWGFSLFVVLALLPGVPKLRPFIWTQLVDNSALQE